MIPVRIHNVKIVIKGLFNCNMDVNQESRELPRIQHLERLVGFNIEFMDIATNHMFYTFS